MNKLEKFKDPLYWMRKAGRLAYETLDEVEKYIKEGISTEYLDYIAYSYIMHRALHNKYISEPPLIKYLNFGHTMCLSVNEELCHIKPSYDRHLVNGDVLKLDIVVKFGNYYADMARTFIVGKGRMQDPFDTGLYDFLKPGVRLSQIAQVTSKHFKHVVSRYGGHFIGTEIHIPPFIPNSLLSLSQDLDLRAGDFICIEPMYGTTSGDVITQGLDVYMEDGLPGYHFEHTIAITNNGYEILTRRNK